MRVYISGPMTGIPEFNFPEFEKAELFLVGKGHTTVNPAKVKQYQYTQEELDHLNDLKVDEAHKSWLAYIIGDLIELITCDAIYMLHGWENSPGANVEFKVALKLKMRVLFQHSEEA